MFYVYQQEDYRRTVTEIDEKEYISLKIIVSELRNQYVCHDIILFFFFFYQNLLSSIFSVLYFSYLFFFPIKVTLHDMILKNIEKIKRPRSSNTDALYWCTPPWWPSVPPRHLTMLSLPYLLSYSSLVLVLQGDIHKVQYNQQGPSWDRNVASIDGHNANVLF